MKAKQSNTSRSAPHHKGKELAEAEIRKLEDQLLRDAPFDNWAVNHGSQVERKAVAKRAAASHKVRRNTKHA